MKRKCVGILVFVVMLMVGCSNSNTAIYNSDEEIAGYANSYNLVGDIQSIEGDKFVGEVEKFEGMDTIWVYEASEDMELEITYLINVMKGNMKLVLISPEHELTEVIERSNQATFTDYAKSTVQIKKGMNRLKMVGSKECSVKFEIIISCGEFRKLGM